MLSKIIIILLSLLLILVSLSFLGQVPNIEIQALLLPNLDKLNFSGMTTIIILAISLILMILGLLFSSIESSSKVQKLLVFLQKGMPDDKLLKLDKTSKNIAEYIKGIAGNLSVNENTSLASLTENNTIEETGKDIEDEVKKDVELETGPTTQENEFTKETLEEVSKSQTEELLPFENNKEDESLDDDSYDSEDTDDFVPNLPDPNEFDDNEKKTVVASVSELEALQEKESGNFDAAEVPSYQSSKFSDFSSDEDSSEGAETIIASVPEELLKQIQNEVEDSNKVFKSVYKTFYDMKIELGESVSSLTEEAFVKKLIDTEKKLINTSNCKRVEFTVYNKNGKAALKATPKY